jgi:hypothetical protein
MLPSLKLASTMARLLAQTLASSAQRLPLPMELLEFLDLDLAVSMEFSFRKAPPLQPHMLLLLEGVQHLLLAACAVSV